MKPVNPGSGCLAPGWVSFWWRGGTLDLPLLVNVYMVLRRGSTAREVWSKGRGPVPKVDSGRTAAEGVVPGSETVLQGYPGEESKPRAILRELEDDSNRAVGLSLRRYCRGRKVGGGWWACGYRKMLVRPWK